MAPPGSHFGRDGVTIRGSVRMCSVTDKERKGSFWKSYIAFSGFSRSKQTMSCVQWDCFCSFPPSPADSAAPKRKRVNPRGLLLFCFSHGSVFPLLQLERRNFCKEKRSYSSQLDVITQLSEAGEGNSPLRRSNKVGLGVQQAHTLIKKTRKSCTTATVATAARP